MPSAATMGVNHLVQLRTVSLDIEIEAAQVELRLRQQAENELQQSLPTEIASAEAVVEEVKVRLEFSKENYERLLNLNKSGGGVPDRKSIKLYSTYRSQKQLALGAEGLLKKLRPPANPDCSRPAPKSKRRKLKFNACRN